MGPSDKCRHDKDSCPTAPERSQPSDFICHLTDDARQVLATHGCTDAGGLLNLDPRLLLVDMDLATVTLAELLEGISIVTSSRASAVVHDTEHTFTMTLRKLLSTRAFNTVTRLGATSRRTFLRLSEAELLNMRSCGKKTAEEILGLQSRLRYETTLEESVEQREANETPIGTCVSLSERARSALKNLGLKGLPDLIRLTEDDLMAARNCGRKTAEEILLFRSQVLSVALNPSDIRRLAHTIASDRQWLAEGDPTKLLPHDLIRQIWRQVSLDAATDCDIAELVLLPESCIETSTGRHGIARLRKLRAEICRALGDELITGCRLGVLSDPFYSEPNSYWYTACRAIGMLCKSQRDFGILLHRHGLLGQPYMMLEELGNLYDLTRERVRQLEERALAHRLQISGWWNVLEPIAARVVDTLRLYGGVASAQEVIEDGFGHDQHFQMLRHAAPFISLLSDCPLVVEAGISIDDEIVYTQDAPRLVEWVADRLTRAAAQYADERVDEALWSISVSLLKEQLLASGPGPGEHYEVQRLSDIVIERALDISGGLYRHEDRVYSIGLYRLRFGTRAELAEEILRRAGRPLSADEIRLEVMKWRPDEEPVSTESVRSWIDHSDLLLRWDRGLYTHAYSVSLPASVMGEVEDVIRARLSEGIPFHSIHGIFYADEERFRSAGLPSPTALYSCLRCHGSGDIDYPRYPYAVLPGVERMQVSVALEEFALDAGGPFTIEQLRRYATDDLGMTELHVGLNLQIIPAVLRVGRSRYCHLRNIGYDHQRIGVLASEILREVRENGVISIREYYQRRLVSCAAAGIPSPEALYSVLEHIGSEELSFPRFPQIAHTEHQVGNARIELERFLRELGRPSGYDELEETFLSGIGFSRTLIYGAAYSESICRYAPGTIVHRDVVGWDASTAMELAKVARSFIDEAEERRQPFGFIDHLLEHPALPRLRPGIGWTHTLLADRLCSLDGFQVVGSMNNVLLRIPNARGIRDFAGLIHFILEIEYDGAAQLSEFEAAMRDRGIVRRRVTESMLGADSPVVIKGNTIVLSELRSHAH